MKKPVPMPEAYQCKYGVLVKEHERGRIVRTEYFDLDEAIKHAKRAIARGVPRDRVDVRQVQEQSLMDFVE